ncbi:MAG: BlaI/MecI/CopY family transcriptional regulator [Gemmatimonadaceae bacterium]
MIYSLTELQLAIMTVLWERGEASVVDIHDALRTQRRLAQSTVATLLARMQEKGVVTHRVEGRQFIYRATATAEQVRHSVVNEFAHMTERLFSGDVASVVSQLLSSREVAPDDLARVREIIDKKEKAQRRDRGKK